MNTEHASIEDVRRLAKRVKDNWTLCEFLGKSEAELMIAQTIHAAVINHKEHGEPFSFSAIRGDGGGGLVKNSVAFRMILDQGLVVQDQRQGKEVLFPTKELVKRLDEFLGD